MTHTFLVWYAIIPNLIPFNERVDFTIAELQTERWRVIHFYSFTERIEMNKSEIATKADSSTTAGLKISVHNCWRKSSE